MNLGNNLPREIPVEPGEDKDLRDVRVSITRTPDNDVAHLGARPNDNMKSSMTHARKRRRFSVVATATIKLQERYDYLET